MKRLAIYICLFWPLLLFSQSYSWQGNGISSNEKLHYLNIFVNIIYDEHPEYNEQFSDTTYWPPVTDTTLEGINTAAIPTYLLNWMDTVYVPGNLKGTCTRLYGESSFDSLQLTGDFVVVNIREKTVLRHGNFHYWVICSVALSMLQQANSFSIFKHLSLSDFNARNFLIRNITQNYGGINPSCGYGGINTIQCVGDGNFPANPTGIVSHEISHGLFGTNDFHTSGGNHRGTGCTMPFMNIQGGHGLMGAAGSGLVSCNGYERWRMHWKHPSSPYYIGARNYLNTTPVNSDISKADGTKSFVLRDFVTYGDAVRIQLPYKDSTITPNQYIWLEFHNVGHNNKLDFLQYSNTNCLYQGTPGIYAYYQIGRDILEGPDSLVWDEINRDNLRVISNEGYWDYTQYQYPVDTDFVCTGWGEYKYYYAPEYSNAFCGYQDQECFIVPKWYDTDLGNTVDSVFDQGLFVGTERRIREESAHNMMKNGVRVTYSMPSIGDSLDAFSSHRRINMGTNPSTCNAKTYYTNSSGKSYFYFTHNTQYNDTTTYLTGLSIEMMPLGDTLWRVLVRWNDYDITDDARWTGRIVLKGAEQVNLTSGHSITLAQNRTPAQRLRDIESGYFAAPTELTCEAGSHFAQQPHSTLLLTEKSQFVLDSGATYHLGDSAQILVREESSFTISRGADFTGGIAAEIVVDSLSTLYVYDTAKLRREARIIVRPGGKLIVNGGTLTNACDDEMWQGIFVEGNTNLRQGALAQGNVILTNATIENARDAICTRKAGSDPYIEHAGGIIQATNTLFRNNRRSVEFLRYENHTTGGAVTDNASYFTRCTFTVDNNNLFAQNGTSFNNHVTMWKVRGVKFNGCAFRNETANHGGKAIYTEEAGFIARRVCPMPTIEPCVCNNYGTDTVRRCLFVGFDTAVHATNTEGSYLVTLDNCDFADNYIGVELAAADNARVSFCDFDMVHTVNGNVGLDMKNSTGYTVEGNSFHRTNTSTLTSIGICVDNSGTAENVMRLNEFTKIKYGCYAWNCNAETRTRPSPGLQYTCNDYDSCRYGIFVGNAANIRSIQGSASVGADNSFYNNIGSGKSISIPANHSNVKYYYYDSGSHAPVGSSNYTPLQSTNANSCASTLCGLTPLYPRDGLTALEQYLSMAEEYAALVETVHAPSLQTDATDPQDDTDDADVIVRLSDLSAQMGDLARAEILNILNDSVPDMALLKRWYATIMETQNFASPQMADSTIPVAAYQLAETYSMEGDLAAAATLLASLPQQFTPDEASRSEYANYMALQQLRETVAGNWYAMTDTDIAAMRQVAEYDNGRAARMSKEILCFFHHICYEDEPLWDMDGIGERALRGDGACPGATTNDGTLRIHPNPTTHTLTVETASPIRTLTVYDLAGRVMMTVDGGDAISVMDVSSLPNGIYLLRAVTDSGVETGRFVKN